MRLDKVVSLVAAERTEGRLNFCVKLESSRVRRGAARCTLLLQRHMFCSGLVTRIPSTGLVEWLRKLRKLRITAWLKLDCIFELWQRDNANNMALAFGLQKAEHPWS